MLLILKDMEGCLKSLILSFWLVQSPRRLARGENLSSLAEGFPIRLWRRNDEIVGTELAVYTEQSLLRNMDCLTVDIFCRLHHSL
jgi:hypothetical protein